MHLCQLSLVHGQCATFLVIQNMLPGQCGCRLRALSWVQMQMPYQGQTAGMQAELPMPHDIPATFPMDYGHDTSMDSLDCLGDVGLFPPQQSNSLPDYSDLNQAASQMQVCDKKIPRTRDAMVSMLPLSVRS